MTSLNCRAGDSVARVLSRRVVPAILSLAALAPAAWAQCAGAPVWHDGGDAKTIALRGVYGYVGYEGDIRIADLTNPASPLPVSRVVIEFEPADMDLAGDYLYAVGGDTLKVINVANPASPSVAATLAVTSVDRVSASTSVLGVVSGVDLKLYDLANPASPVLASTFDPLGFVHDVIIQGTTAYVLASGDIYTLDVSNPASPVTLDTYSLTLSSIFERITLRGGTLAALSWDGVEIVDVSNPAAITFESTIPIDSIVDAIDFGFANGQPLLHFQSDYDEIKTYDLTNPAAPTFRSSTTILSPDGIFALGKMTYVITSGSILAYDFTSPSTPVLVHTSDPAFDVPLDIAVSGGRAFVTSWDGLSSFDVTTPASPGAPTSVAIAGDDARALAESGTTLFVGERDGGSGVIQTFGVSNPASPVLLGSFARPSSVTKLAIDGATLFALDSSPGTLAVIDAANPAAMALRSEIGVNGYLALEAWGGFAFVGDYNVGVEVIDARDPAHPALIATHPPRGGELLAAFEMRGPIAFIAQTDSQVDILDMTDPVNPVFKGSFTSAGGIGGLGAFDSLLVVSDNDGHFRFVDVADPSNPTFLSDVGVGGGADRFDRRGSTLWAAGGTSGIFGVTIPNVVRFSSQPAPQTFCPATPSLALAVTLANPAGATYQWKRGGVNVANGPAPGGASINGATTATLTITNPSISQVGNYTCTVTNACGSATTAPALLSFASPLVILQQPADVAVCPEGAAAFEVAGLGTLPATYRWQHETSPGVWTDMADGVFARHTIAGATQRVLTISANAGRTLPGATYGAYRVLVANACGSVTSQPADLLAKSPDVTQDGNADQDDVAYLINVVGGGANTTGIDPDINADGNVDQVDVIALIDWIAGGGCP